MNNGTITYGQLSAKLEALGYKQYYSEAGGRTARLYEHPAIEEALILLPDADDEDVVAPPFLNKVLLILRTHGLLEEKNPLLT
jgi:hypothetical protein